MSKVQYDAANAKNIEANNTLYQAETAGVVHYNL